MPTIWAVLIEACLWLKANRLKMSASKQAEAAIWEELEKIKKELVPADELTKVKNKTESTMVFSEMSLLDKAMNLAQFELFGDADMLNHETEKYLAITAEQIKEQAQKMYSEKKIHRL